MLPPSPIRPHPSTPASRPRSFASDFLLSRFSGHGSPVLADDHLTIKAYFSDGLPPPYSQNARYVRDLLDEYYNAADGKLSYEFLDPMATESSEDKEKRKEVRRDIFGRAIREETDMERELRSLGIQPVEVRVNQGDNLEVKRVYMGISVRYGDQQEAIPVVVDTSSLEYDLTTLIRKVSRPKTPTIGLVTGRDGLDLNQDLDRLALQI